MPIPSAGAGAGGAQPNPPAVIGGLFGTDAGAGPDAGAGAGGSAGAGDAGAGDADSGAGGESGSSTGANPGAVIPCTATGAQWCSGLSGHSLSEHASAIARDAQGNLVILGRTGGSISGAGHASFDVFVAKYAPDGTLLWVTQHGRERREVPGTLAIDAMGNIVFGYNADLNLLGTVNAGFAAKLSGSGGLIWTRELGTFLDGNVAADAAGNVFFAGRDRAGLILGKLTPDNELIWSKPQLGGVLTVDADGSVIASRITDSNVSLAKISAAGELLWNDATYGASAFAVDPDRNVYGLGKSIRRYSSEGTLAWDVPKDAHLYLGNDIAADANGNAYVVGIANDFTGTGYDAYVSKYSSSGELIGGRALGVSAAAEGFQLVAADNGELYVAGALLTGGVFVARLSL